MLMRRDVAGNAQGLHVLPLVAERMALRQAMVRLGCGALLALMTDGVGIQIQAVPFLTAIRLAGAGLRTPCAGVAHSIFPFSGLNQPSRCWNLSVPWPPSGGRARLHFGFDDDRLVRLIWGRGLALLDVSEGTVNKFIRDGKLTIKKVGRRTLVQADSVRTFLA